MHSGRQHLGGGNTRPKRNASGYAALHSEAVNCSFPLSLTHCAFDGIGVHRVLQFLPPPGKGAGV